MKARFISEAMDPWKYEREKKRKEEGVKQYKKRGEAETKKLEVRSRSKKHGSGKWG